MGQQQTIVKTVIANISTILGVIGLFLIAPLYFTSPGWDIATLIRNTVTLAVPAAGLITSLVLLRRHILNVISRRETLPYDVIVIVAALGTLSIYFAGGAFLGKGLSEPTLAGISNYISTVGTQAVTAAIAISVISPMLRIYKAKTLATAYCVVVSIIGIMTYSPLGMMISPIIPQIGDFIQTYISGASDSAFWIASFIGGYALVTKMILLKEKMQPGR